MDFSKYREKIIAEGEEKRDELKRALSRFNMADKIDGFVTKDGKTWAIVWDENEQFEFWFALLGKQLLIDLYCSCGARIWGTCLRLPASLEKFEEEILDCMKKLNDHECLTKKICPLTKELCYGRYGKKGSNSGCVFFDEYGCKLSQIFDRYI